MVVPHSSAVRRDQLRDVYCDAGSSSSRSYPPVSASHDMLTANRRPQEQSPAGDTYRAAVARGGGGHVLAGLTDISLVMSSLSDGRESAESLLPHRPLLNKLVFCVFPVGSSSYAEPTTRAGSGAAALVRRELLYGRVVRGVVVDIARFPPELVPVAVFGVEIDPEDEAEGPDSSARVMNDLPSEQPHPQQPLVGALCLHELSLRWRLDTGGGACDSDKMQSARIAAPRVGSAIRATIPRRRNFSSSYLMNAGALFELSIDPANLEVPLSPQQSSLDVAAAVRSSVPTEEGYQRLSFLSALYTDRKFRNVLSEKPLTALLKRRLLQNSNRLAHPSLPWLCGDAASAAKILVKAQSEQWSMQRVEQGIACIKAGKSQEYAINRHYTSAIQLDPANVEAYVARGAAHANLGHLRQALSDLDEALRLNPEHVNARAYRQRIVLKAKQDKESRLLSAQSKDADFVFDSFEDGSRRPSAQEQSNRRSSPGRGRPAGTSPVRRRRSPCQSGSSRSPARKKRWKRQNRSPSESPRARRQPAAPARSKESAKSLQDRVARGAPSAGFVYDLVPDDDVPVIGPQAPPRRQNRKQTRRGGPSSETSSDDASPSKLLRASSGDSNRRKKFKKRKKKKKHRRSHSSSSSSDSTSSSSPRSSSSDRHHRRRKKQHRRKP